VGFASINVPAEPIPPDLELPGKQPGASSRLRLAGAEQPGGGPGRRGQRAVPQGRLGLKLLMAAPAGRSFPVCWPSCMGLQPGHLLSLPLRWRSATLLPGAGLVNPAIVVTAGSSVSIEVINADPDTAHGDSHSRHALRPDHRRGVQSVGL